MSEINNIRVCVRARRRSDFLFPERAILFYYENSEILRKLGVLYTYREKEREIKKKTACK